MMWVKLITRSLFANEIGLTHLGLNLSPMIWLQLTHMLLATVATLSIGSTHLKQGDTLLHITMHS